MVFNRPSTFSVSPPRRLMMLLTSPAVPPWAKRSVTEDWPLPWRYRSRAYEEVFEEEDFGLDGLVSKV